MSPAVHKSIQISLTPVFPARDLRASVRFSRAMAFMGEAYEERDENFTLARGGADVHLGRSEMLVEGQNGSGCYFYLPHGTAATLEPELLAAGGAILSPPQDAPWKMIEFVISGSLPCFGDLLSEGTARRPFAHSCAF
jgi:hypothetical protein